MKTFSSISTFKVVVNTNLISLFVLSFLRQRSGADIKIQDPLPGKSDRVITISGNPEQIQYGQFLMQQRYVILPLI